MEIHSGPYSVDSVYGGVPHVPILWPIARNVIDSHDLLPTTFSLAIVLMYQMTFHRNVLIVIKAINRGKSLCLGLHFVALIISLPWHFSPWNLIIKLKIM